MSRPVLSPNRQKVFDFLLKYKQEQDGNTPTIREIADALEINSTSVVTYYLDKLEIAGLIKRKGRMVLICGACWLPPTQKKILS